MTAFKAYDIRGKLDTEVTPKFAYELGRAYADVFQPQTIVVGADVRLSSNSLKTALIHGLNDGGVDVLDLGLAGTEEVYFAALALDVEGGIEITASHNPLDYNGMKLVGKQARPIGKDTGLTQLETYMQNGDFLLPSRQGECQKYDIVPQYIAHLMGYLKPKLKPLKIVTNPGHGAAGHIVDALEAAFMAHNLPIELIKIQHHPDGHFPMGIPNPMLVENRVATREAVLEHHADFGVAWDGDFDRCFFFDEQGQFIEGYYMVGLLAQAFLQQAPQQKIVHDPRLIWNTLDIIEQHQGIAVASQSGHAYIKQVMRQENAIYGGEMSAHHYFRDFGYCDSGMIPWLLMMNLLSTQQLPLSALTQTMQQRFPCSGEINFTVKDAQSTILALKMHFADQVLELDDTDGLGFDFGAGRFNIRASNTEPLLRLNIETRTEQQPQPIEYYIQLLTDLINLHG